MPHTKRARDAQAACNKLLSLYDDALNHDGYADLRIEMRILKRGQKEVILHAGKQYRFVVDCSTQPTDERANEIIGLGPEGGVGPLQGSRHMPPSQ